MTVETVAIIIPRIFATDSQSHTLTVSFVHIFDRGKLNLPIDIFSI